MYSKGEISFQTRWALNVLFVCAQIVWTRDDGDDDDDDQDANNDDNEKDDDAK